MYILIRFCCLPKEPPMLPRVTDEIHGYEKGEDPKFELPYLLLKGMATCHSLTIIDSVLNGDPLDLKVLKYPVFSSKQWN